MVFLCAQGVVSEFSGHNAKSRLNLRAFREKKDFFFFLFFPGFFFSIALQIFVQLLHQHLTFIAFYHFQQIWTKNGNELVPY